VVSNTLEYCKSLIELNKDYQYTKTFTRHLRDLDTLDKEVFRFNDKLADMYILVLQSFVHSKGELANQPIILEDWQKASIGIAFGWEIKNSKGKWVRRFNTVLYYMARKQGKSLLSAALAITDSILRQQWGSEIAMIATKADQAKLVWGEIDKMVKKHPEFKSLFKQTGNKIYSKIDDGTIYFLGRDSKTLDGLNISIIVADEVHAMAGPDLIDVCKSSQGAREQPLRIYISTAGFNLASPLVPELEHSRKILDDTIKDERYFAFLAEPSKDDEPYSIETLRKSNPNINVSVSEEFLIGEMNSAKDMPNLRTNYLTKYLNVFVNASEEFINVKDWKSCASTERPEIDFNEIKTILVGCDLSTNDDLTGIVTAYVNYDDSVYIESDIFMPETRVDELAKKFRVPLAQWVKNGNLRTTKGNIIDYNEIYDVIKSKIDEATNEGVDIEVHYDAYKFKSIKSRLENEIGFEEAYPVNQGFVTLSEPLSLLANYIRNGKITHLNNVVMNWNISNVVVKRDNYGNQMIDKSNQYRKIDGVAALANIFVGLLPKLSQEETTNEIFFV